MEEHTLTMDAEVKEMQKHHHPYFNLNALETTLLSSAVVVLLAGIVFDSAYIWQPEFFWSNKIITYATMVMIICTLVYYFALTYREIRLAKKKRATRRKVAWKKIKHGKKSLLSKMKLHKKKKHEEFQKGALVGKYVRVVKERSIYSNSFVI